jgi:hypothetical protein
MVAHHCHLPGCKVTTPPRWLLCRTHWAKVPAMLQTDVIETVGDRARTVNATWAPWWRAAHRAIAHVMRAEGRQCEMVERWLAHKLAFADRLEAPRG